LAKPMMEMLAEVEASEWKDWKWQQRNAVRTVDHLTRVFSELPSDVCENIRRNMQQRRFQITPYASNLIQREPGHNRPAPNDPLWRQFIPGWPEETSSDFGYDGHTDNWEMPGEMVTPIAQHKYDNRIIVRIANVCLSYCQFCYEALRTLEKRSSKDSFQEKHWDETVQYIRRTPAVEEVILSGGEPMMQQDEELDRVLFDLDSVGRPIVKRIHTRALTFNPYRITPEITQIFSRRKLNALGLHVTHPNEITPEFLEAVDRLHSAVPILFANIPLLRTVNDSKELMHTLGMKLYSCGVIPHYLYHFMPHSPGMAEFRTSVQAGVDIVRSLKRHISNLAVPEFVIPHHTGKYSPPLLDESETKPRHALDGAGHTVFRFENWLGKQVDYPDESLDALRAEYAGVQASRARSVLEIDLEAVRHNLRIIRKCAGPAKIMAVVKGDAYGLGAVPIARALESEGVDAFATDNVAEGIQLRENRITRPIMIIDGDVAENAKLAVAYELTPGIADEELLAAYQDAASAKQKKHPVWLVANVGFNRSGYRNPDKFKDFAEKARNCPNLAVQAVYAHLTHANGDEAISRSQIAEYEGLAARAKEVLGPQLEMILFASHGLVRWAAEFPMSWIRPGLVLLGEHDFAADVFDRKELENVRHLRPAMKLRARIAHILDFERSEGVGYGQRNWTRVGQRLATLASGFRDGYPLRGEGQRAIVCGKVVSVFGDAGMDALQIDVTNVPEAKVNDWAVLIGADQEHFISAREVARAARTNVYKFLSGLRSQRIYLNERLQ